MDLDECLDPSIAARDTALRLLGRREHSRRELLAKLALRGFESSLAHCIVDDLEKGGLQSDRRYAEAIVRIRRGRLQGSLKIQSELQRRGVNKSMINEALEPYSDEWVDLAAAFIKKRGMAGLLTDIHQRQKVYRRLANRGFSHNEAITAIEEIRSG